MITGARQGALSGLRRLAAAAMARDLNAFLIPGPDIARAHGLDIEVAGLQRVASPRHASVLLIVGAIPPALREAAAVIYAQMVRPRALFVLGTKEFSPLPAADVMAGLSQQELVEGVHRLRRVFAEGAFRTDVSDFDAPVLEIRIEYTCSMHPEIIRDEPGSCPRCGMDLIPRETQAGVGHTHTDQKKTDAGMDMQAASTHDHNTHAAMDHNAVAEYTCPMHPEVVQSEPGSCPQCGMTLEPREVQTEPTHEHMHMEHDAAVEYTCPMHPEVVLNEPGSCPKCGMNLEPREAQTEATHNQHHMNHDTTVEYTCPMHPEVVQNEPGSCPKCGMNLEPRETQTETTHDHHHMEHDAPVEYTCPMHPEVIQNEPGSCPKCGMNLEPREAQTEPTHDQHHMGHDAAFEYTCPMHPEVVQNEPGSCPQCGMNLEPREAQAEPTHDHHHMEHDAPVEYTCPMHPEVVQNEPGSCPQCGMTLEPREIQDTQSDEHTGMDHSAMDPDDMSFMSMLDVTKDLPRSGDGLPMEWIDAPFGPFFPGLPGGLLLTLTLDGDTVARSDARSLTENVDLLHHSPMDTTDFVEQLAGMDPLAPVAYRLLACRALENAADTDAPAAAARARIGALERERIASHLGWLALFGQQTGFDWLMRRAASLQLKFQHASLKQVAALKPAIQTLAKRLQRTPLLKARTAGIGRLAPDAALRGPVARATGIGDDARSTDKICTTLGFTTVSRKEGDALARLQVRMDEITHSLALIEAAGAIELPAPIKIGEVSATGEAVVETPRGLARLQLTLETGQVVAAQLETPSTHHLALIDPLIEQQELGDALVAVGSLDLSPWEVRP